MRPVRIERGASRAVLLALLGAAASRSPAAAGEGEPRMPLSAKVLPARTKALVVADDLRVTLADARKTAAFLLWSEPEVRAFVAPFVEGTQLGRRLEAAVLSLGGEVSFAFTGLEERERRLYPEAVFAAQVSDRAAVARALSDFFALLDGLGLAETREWDVGPVRMGFLSPTGRAWGPLMAGYVLSGSSLYFGVGPEGRIVAEVAAAATGNAGGRTLADSPDLRRALARVERSGGRRDLFAFVDLNALATAFAAAVEARRPELRETLALARGVADGLGLESVRSVSLLDAVDPPGWRSELAVDLAPREGAEAGRKGLFRMLSGPPVSRELLSLVPEGARFAFAWRMDSAELMPVVRAFARRTGGMVEQRYVQVVEGAKAMGLDIARGFLGDAGNGVSPGLGIEGAVFPVPGTLTGPLAWVPGLVVVLRAQDPERALAAYRNSAAFVGVGAMALGVRFEQEDLGGGSRLFCARAPAGLTPAFTFHRGYVVAGATADAVRSAVASIDSPAAKGLAVSAGYEYALARAGRAPRFAVGYADGFRREDVELALSALPVLSAAFRSSALQFAGPAQREFWGRVNTLDLPPAAVLVKHSGPAAVVGWSDETAVGLASYGPCGMTTLAASGVAALWGGLTLDIASRQVRRQEALAAWSPAGRNLMAVGEALRAHATDHGGKLPASLDDLVRDGRLAEPKLLASPVTNRRFAYVTGLTDSDPAMTIVAFEEGAPAEARVAALRMSGRVTVLAGGAVERQVAAQLRAFDFEGREGVAVVREAAPPPPSTVPPAQPPAGGELF